MELYHYSAHRHRPGANPNRWQPPEEPIHDENLGEGYLLTDLPPETCGLVLRRYCVDSPDAAHPVSEYVRLEVEDPAATPVREHVFFLPASRCAGCHLQQQGQLPECPYHERCYHCPENPDLT